MTNHIHLVVQVGETPLSRIMQNVSQRYTQWFNWRHKKRGHVFQGRYKAIMVDADEYLLELVAYVHLNPVRAHITDHPEKHPWSSHRAFLGKENLPWLENRAILAQFSSKVREARVKFVEFVAERMTDGRRAEFHGENTLDSRIVGDDSFIDEVLIKSHAIPEQKPDVNAIVVAVTLLYEMDEHRLKAPGQERVASEARALAAWATCEFSNGKLIDLARRVGRDASTLTCAVRRLVKRKEKEPVLTERMEQLRQNLLDVQVFKA
jgi:hypothetical protein